MRFRTRDRVMRVRVIRVRVVRVRIRVRDKTTVRVSLVIVTIPTMRVMPSVHLYLFYVAHPLFLRIFHQANAEAAAKKKAEK